MSRLLFDRVGFFEALLRGPASATRTRRAVDHAVIDRTASGHHAWRRTTCALARPARSSPAPTARMQACGGLMTAAKFLDAEHAEIGDREAAALEFLRLQLAGAWRARRGPSSRSRSAARPLVSALRTIGVIRPPVDRHRDARCRRACTASCPSSVHEALHVGMLAQRHGAGLDHEVVDRELVAPFFSADAR